MQKFAVFLCSGYKYGDVFLYEYNSKQKKAESKFNLDYMPFFC